MIERGSIRSILVLSSWRSVNCDRSVSDLKYSSRPTHSSTQGLVERHAKYLYFDFQAQSLDCSDPGFSGYIRKGRKMW